MFIEGMSQIPLPASLLFSSPLSRSLSRISNFVNEAKLPLYFPIPFSSQTMDIDVVVS